MNKANIRLIAAKIEERPDLFDQSICPIETSETSCGCVAHFIARELPTTRGWASLAIEEAFDIPSVEAMEIYRWAYYVTAAQAASMLFELADYGYE